MYGKKRTAKKFGKKRTAGSLTSRNIYTRLKKAGYGSKASGARFATVAFNRNIEKKYWDKSYAGTVVYNRVGFADGNFQGGGIMYTSSAWAGMNFVNNTGTATSISNDMSKGLITGTTARTRVGNKIVPNYYKGAFTFTAAMCNTIGTNISAQGGEAYATPSSGYKYLRTTYRMVIVKDMQVNSTDPAIDWTQVFETSAASGSGVHSELNVDNMGRFIVLEDKYFTVDADTPQKTVPFKIKGSRVGSIRYNGPSATALTDKGVYIIYAAFIAGIGHIASSADFQLPAVTGNTRLCFRDE